MATTASTPTQTPASMIVLPQPEANAASLNMNVMEHARPAEDLPAATATAWEFA